MIYQDNKIEKNKLLLSIRDVNITQSQQNCKPKENCPKICSPSCNASQICAFKSITECGVCPPTYCIENRQLRVNNFEENSSSSYKKTALIAGLTTGLVVFALIIATVAGFVFYRRRKVRHEKEYNNSMQQKEYSIHHTPSTPNSSIIPPPMAYLPPISQDLKHLDTQFAWNQVNYDDPQSPFIIGAQSLQIPHLDDITTTPDPSNNNNNSIIRRSLNIQSTTTPLIDINGVLGRASSVKVTKLDKRTIIPNNSDDDLNNTVLRRAISVKKNNNNSNTSSMTRVGSNTSSQDIVYAKPTMVRINTILKRDQQSGIIRKTSIRTVIEDNNDTNTRSNEDNSKRMDFYLCPPPPLLQQRSSSTSSITTDCNPSQTSVQSSTSSHSTFGDGSITVYLEPSSTP